VTRSARPSPPARRIRPPTCNRLCHRPRTAWTRPRCGRGRSTPSARLASRSSGYCCGLCAPPECSRLRPTSTGAAVVTTLDGPKTRWIRPRNATSWFSGHSKILYREMWPEIVQNTLPKMHFTPPCEQPHCLLLYRQL